MFSDTTGCASTSTPDRGPTAVAMTRALRSGVPYGNATTWVLSYSPRTIASDGGANEQSQGRSRGYTRDMESANPIPIGLSGPAFRAATKVANRRVSQPKPANPDQTARASSRSPATSRICCAYPSRRACSSSARAAR
jgi:hypothetical protein